MRAPSEIQVRAYLKSTTKALPVVSGLLEAAIMAVTTSSISGSGIPARRREAAVPKMFVLTNCRRGRFDRQLQSSEFEAADRLTNGLTMLPEDRVNVRRFVSKSCREF